MVIRLLTDEDLPAINAMTKEYTDMLPDHPGITLTKCPHGYIIINDAGPIGFITFSELTDYYFIHNLYVKNGWRRRNIGTMLMQLVPTDKTIFLKVRTDHHDSRDALGFYRAHQFEEIRGIDEKRILMKKSVKPENP